MTGSEHRAIENHWQGYAWMTFNKTVYSIVELSASGTSFILHLISMHRACISLFDIKDLSKHNVRNADLRNTHSVLIKHDCRHHNIELNRYAEQETGCIYGVILTLVSHKALKHLKIAYRQASFLLIKYYFSSLCFSSSHFFKRFSFWKLS